jgi:hypothetical protein
MSIEIRQLLIKSTVLPARGEPARTEPRELPRVRREELLAECRRMLREMLDARRER